MVTYQIYSVSDKQKVDAEVVEVREVSGSRGVRYQVVGLTPEGKNVSTFCNQQTADDLRTQLGTAEAPETTETSETVELAAEEESTEEVDPEVSEEVTVEDAEEVAEVTEDEEEMLDRIVEIVEEADAPLDLEVDEGEAPVIDDETGELIETEVFAAEDDPVPVEEDPGDTEVIADEDGTVMAAEGEAEVEVQEEEQYDEVPDETGGGISPTPPDEPEEETEIEIPTSDTSGLVPLSEQIPEGYGPVLGQQTLEYNFGPMHAETEMAPPGDEYALMEQLVRLEEKMGTEDDDEKRTKIEKKIIGIVNALEDIASEDADRSREYDRGQPLYYPDDEDEEGYELWEQWDSEDEGTLGRKLLIPGLVLGGFALIAAFKPELVKNLLDNFKKE